MEEALLVQQLLVALVAAVGVIAGQEPQVQPDKVLVELHQVVHMVVAVAAVLPLLVQLTAAILVEQGEAEQLLP